jgi:pyrophosphatase PpaX
MAKPKTTILFDLDGTLIDSIELILSSMRYAFRTLDRPCPSDEEWTAGIGIPLFTAFRRYAPEDADHRALIAAYRDYQLANHDRLVRCYDHVIDVVGTLRARGHQTGVVTSKGEWLAMRGLAHVGLASSMDTVVGADSSSRHKPDPEPVRIALHRLACSPENALYVGDSVHDLVAGRAAGVLTGAALWGAFQQQDMEPGQPDFWLESISDLPALVQTLQVVQPSK